MLGFSAREADRRSSQLPPWLPRSDVLASRESTAASMALPDCYRRIWLGTMPALVTGEIRDWDLYYRSYFQTCLERDVRYLAQVGDLSVFSRFVRACAARTGQLLNYSDLARDVDVSMPTAKHWLSILEASFQVLLLAPYHSNVTRRLVKTRKLDMLDTGLCSWLTRWSTPETLAAGAMSGRGAMIDTYNLVAAGIRQVVRRVARCLASVG